jgi:hypothetical protein
MITPLMDLKCLVIAQSGAVTPASAARRRTCATVRSVSGRVRRLRHAQTAAAAMRTAAARA